MKRFLVWASAAVLSVAGLAACDGGSGGGGGGSGITGSWVLDGEKTFPPIIEKMWTAMEPLRQQMASMTAEQKAMLPPEQKEQMEAMSSKEGMKKLMAKDAEGTTFEIKSDGTYSGATKKKGHTSTLTGTWKAAGSGYTFTPGTEDGKPVNGAKDKPHEARLEGGYLVLVMKNDDASMPGAPDMATVNVYLKRK